MSIHLIQLLCPRRHCLVGAAWDDAIESLKEVTAVLDGWMKGMEIER